MAVEARRERDARFRLQRRSHNGGIATASNDALARARGDYVAFVDHDDRLAPHALLMVAEEIRRFAGEATYTLCAQFVTERDHRDRPFWNHPPGKHCFSFDALDDGTVSIDESIYE